MKFFTLLTITTLTLLASSPYMHALESVPWTVEELCDAAFDGNVATAKKRLKGGLLSVDEKSRYGWTPLMLAIAGHDDYSSEKNALPEKSNMPMAIYLLSRGASVKPCRAAWGHAIPPLARAVHIKSYRMCALLIKHKADPFDIADSSDRPQITVLQYAENLQRELEKDPVSIFSDQYRALTKIRDLLEQEALRRLKRMQIDRNKRIAQTRLINAKS